MPILNFGAVKEAILPEWTKPENASVFDPAYRAPVRTLIKWLGLDDPQQVMALGTPLETGAMGGGAVESIAKRFPRFVEALKLNYTTPGQAPFYSRLEEAVGGLPRQFPGPKLLGVVQKGQASAEELAARGVPEFAAQYGNKPIPREAIAEHLKANPVQLQVKVHGGGSSRFKVVDSSTLPEQATMAYQGSGYDVPPYAIQNAEGNVLGFYPSRQSAQEGIDELPSLGIHGTEQTKFSQYQLPGGTNYRETLIQLPDAQFSKPETRFRSSHFDEPNILVHTRSNERELPGLGKGTFLEEVQSDWHQKGKAQGYGKAGVPDAPFKETWPDLALKHHLVEAAQNPETHWLGFTSGETQAARYDLSKQVSSIRYEYEPDAPNLSKLFAYDLNGHQIFLKTSAPSDLSEIIGKEPADRLMKSVPEPSPNKKIMHHEISGVDLKVGGEGMKYFYDTLLPKRMEKIVKPFGGTVERAPIQAGSEQAPAWILRLTPELKKRILTEGLPLMTGVAGVGLASEAQKGQQ